MTAGTDDNNSASPRGPEGAAVTTTARTTVETSGHGQYQQVASGLVEQELQDFFDNASVGLHWVGPDGTILRANRAELELLGYTPDEYIAALPDGDRAGFDAACRRHGIQFFPDSPWIAEL